MEARDLDPLYGLCREGAEVYPEPWRILFAEETKALQARRAAFEALATYVELRANHDLPNLLPADMVERRGYICLGLLCLHPELEVNEEIIRRYTGDLVPGSESA